MDCEPEGPPDSASMLAGNGGSASTTERLLLMLLRQQEAIMTRMDQLQKTVHTIALDVEDVRTGCLEFFDEYRLEYLDTAALLDGSRHGSPAVPSGSNYKLPLNPPASGSPTVITSLSPVNWSKSKPRNAPTIASSRRTSPDEYHSPYQVYAPSENLGGPSTPGSGSLHDDGTVNALRRAVSDILAFPVAPHKVSPETPRGRPTRLPNDPFSPTPAQNSQTHSRHSLSHQPSPPAFDPTDTPTRVSPLNSDDQARTQSPASDSTVTGPPETPSASFPPERVNEVAAEGSHDDSTFNQYVNHGIWDSPSHDTITSRIRTPQSQPVSLPTDDGATTPTSSKVDALLTEAHLFRDACLPSPCNEPAQPDDPPTLSSGIDQIKLELQSLMFASSPMVPPRPETVDPSDLNAMSPLTSLSPTPDPTPRPEVVPSTLTAGRFGLKFMGASTQGKHPAATRIKKRKAKPTLEGNLCTPESDEPPLKRAKQPAVPAVCSHEIQTQGETESPSCPVSWPALTTTNNGFVRKVVMCDSCLWWYHYGCVGVVNKSDKRIKRKAIFLCPVCLVCPERALQRRPKKNEPVAICARVDCNRQTAEYHVAGIIGKALSPIDGQIKWLIKWEGYAVTEATWEGKGALSDSKMLIGKFYQAVKREKGADFDVMGTMPLLLKEAERAGW